MNASTTDGNILDLILTNMPNEFSDILSETYTYHYLLEFYINMEVHKTRAIPRSVFNCNRADMDGLRRDIGNIALHQWTTVEDTWYQLKRKIMKALDRYVPKTRITNKSSPPWTDNEVTEMSKLKHDALKKSIRTKSTIDREPLTSG